VISIQVFNDTQTNSYVLIESTLKKFHMNDFALLNNEDVFFVKKNFDLCVHFHFIFSLFSINHFLCVYDYNFQVV
jgi:hypothetical protein